ncbi:glycosyltransferase [Bradyrhizobium sp. 76]|nr:glycosyltransferase [Bradyrhizobium sp. 76]
MATYNGSKFIAEQLGSLANQTIPPSEVIICDDLSTDDTLQTVAKLRESLPFVVHVHVNQERLGHAANFMKAVSLCTSDVICTCDQDDIWFPTKIERALTVLEDPDVMLVHHNAIVVRDGAELGNLHLQPFPARTERLKWSPWWNAYGFTLSFRRSITRFSHLWLQTIDAHLDEKRMINPRVECHDHWLSFISSVVGAIVYIHEPLAFYRQHGSNAAGWGGKITLLRKVGHMLERRGTIYAHCHRAAAIRTKLLTDASSIATSDIEREQLIEAADHYANLAELYNLRAECHLGSSIFHRASSFFKLVAMAGYRYTGWWTFHPKGLVKDLVLGVVWGKVMRRFGRTPAGSDPTCSAV